MGYNWRVAEHEQLPHARQQGYEVEGWGTLVPMPSRKAQAQAAMNYAEKVAEG